MTRGYGEVLTSMMPGMSSFGRIGGALIITAVVTALAVASPWYATSRDGYILPGLVLYMILLVLVYPIIQLFSDSHQRKE